MALAAPAPPPAPRAPLTTARGPGGLPGAGRCRLCRSLAGPRGAEDPTPLMPPRPPLHPRPVRPPLRVPGPRPPAPAPARAALAKVGVRAPPGRAPFAPAQPAGPCGPSRPRGLDSAPRAPGHPPPQCPSRPQLYLGWRPPGLGDTPVASSPRPPARRLLYLGARWTRVGSPGSPAHGSDPPEVQLRTGGRSAGGPGGSLGLRVSRDPAGRAPGAERAPPPGPRRALGGRRVETAVGFSPGSWRRGRDARRGVCVCAEQTRG